MTVQNFQGALRAYLLDDDTIQTLISSRIYAFPAPQDTDDSYAVIQKISKVAQNNLDGFDNIVSERYQIDVYSVELDTSESIAKAIFDRLHMKNHISMSDYFVYLIQFDNENETAEPENNGSESVYYRISQDFTIKHSYTAV